MIRLLAVLCLSLAAMVVNASAEPHYVMFYYNVQAINKNITDQQCAELFKLPQYYKIINDKVIYDNKLNYSITNYQRTNVTYLHKNVYLFTGVSDVGFDLNGKNQNTKEHIAFVLSIPEQRIQGSFILEGYCKGNLLGTNETVNQWPPV